MKSWLPVVFYFSVLAAWITSVVYDASQSLYGWLAVDLVVSPIGVVRGYLIWLGFV